MVLAVATLATTTNAAPALAVTGVPISGAGSTWAQNAVDQWRRDAFLLGLGVVNFAGTGSADGRSQFSSGTADFAVTDLTYAEAGETAPTRAFTYLPMVAGGLSIAYNLTVAGSRVTALRLSGPTIAGIFTGAITAWDDPRIVRDNPGLHLPHLAVTAVVRSDATGDSYRLSDYLRRTASATWSAFCTAAALGANCPATAQWPTPAAAGLMPMPLALGVAGYTSLPTSNGAITYVATSYALNASLPSAKVRNAAGWFVGPEPQYVSLTLQKATLTADGPPDPASVVGATDRRSYPLSFVSSMVAPTAVDTSFSLDKGTTLGAFAAYSLCTGQTKAPLLGYAALPLDLLALSLTRLATVPGAATPPTVTSCGNPTVAAGSDVLDATVAQPPVCDADARIQCGTALIYPTVATARLTASSRTTVAGRPLTLTARLTGTSVLSGVTGPLRHRKVVVEQRRAGATSWTVVATPTTTSAGTATVVLRPIATSAYRVRYAAGAGTSGAAATLAVGVHFAVSARAQASTVRPLQRIVLSGAVRPGGLPPQRRVLVQELVTSRWVTIARPSLTSTGRFSTWWSTGRTGRHVFRVVMPADASHLSGASAAVVVLVR
jgi:phosphate transport system substrate-binding protein